MHGARKGDPAACWILFASICQLRFNWTANYTCHGLAVEEPDRTSFVGRKGMLSGV